VSRATSAWGRAAAALACAALVASAAGCGGSTSASEGFDDGKDTTMLIPFGAGGGVDLAGRTVADLLQSEKLVKGSIKVENVDGGNAILGMQKVKSAKGSGNELMVTGTHLVVAPLTVSDSGISYKDFTPIATLFAEYVYVYVAADSKYQTMEDVVAALKEDPKSVTFGGGAPGGAGHFGTVELLEGLGIPFGDATYVAYDDNEVVPAILGGQVDVGTGGPELLDLVKGGELRALAVSSDEELEGDSAGIPTFKEAGSDSSLANWRIISGPPDMPKDAVEYWQKALTELTDSDEWQQTLADNGWSPYFHTDDLDKMLAEENDSYAKIIDELGLTDG
jgi:putative tricarboxylic transport membrane protein